MTTSRPDDSPDESAAVATAQAEAEGVGEAEEKAKSAAATAERILTSAVSPSRPAVPAAMAEPEAEPDEPEQRKEESEESEEAEEGPAVVGVAEAAQPEASADGSSARPAAAGPAGRTAADPKTAGSSDMSTATADASAASGIATNNSAKTAAEAAPGRPHKSLLAGAAIVGALLISVPFLISGGDGGHGRPSAKPGATPGTVLDGLAAGAGVVGSESPSPLPSGAHGSAVPKTVVTVGPDGKTVTMTVNPQAGASGPAKKPSSGSAPGTAQTGSGKTSTGSGSGSGAPSNTTNGAAGSDPWPGGVQIYSHASGRCIGIAGSPGAATGSALVIWDCYDVSYQRWTFADGTVRSEGKCMNVQDGATGDGALINWTTCNGSGAQQFRLNAEHDLTNPQSGNKCVDVKDNGTDNGARLQLWTCAGTPNQKWSTRTP